MGATIRPVVTGHAAAGKPVFLSDGAPHIDASFRPELLDKLPKPLELMS